MVEKTNLTPTCFTKGNKRTCGDYIAETNKSAHQNKSLLMKIKKKTKKTPKQLTSTQKSSGTITAVWSKTKITLQLLSVSVVPRWRKQGFHIYSVAKDREPLTYNQLYALMQKRDSVNIQTTRAPDDAPLLVT